MFLVRPEADIPIVTVSINDNLGAKAHFDLGKALAPLRDEHTLIIASGQATHSGRNPSIPAGLENWANEFQEWLDNTLSTSSTWSYDERCRQILDWESLPTAKIAHPTPDHFTPFLVAIGAGASEDAPTSEKLFGGWRDALSFAAYAWGIVN